MDGVSAAVGAAKSIYDAYKTVKTTQKELKHAPEKLQLIEDDRDLVKQLFNELHMASDVDGSGSPRSIWSICNRPSSDAPMTWAKFLPKSRSRTPRAETRLDARFAR
ncbi:hypothetical protein BC629DRAFT_1586855 [Irpex lacteus]|nr:hypothetical protein BC629DRAFT_1586855 [Irpex lacteus]